MEKTIITSLTIGLLATISPCVLPLYPGYLAYISSGQAGVQGKSSRYFLGFFVLAGVLTMMLALGGIIALLSVSIDLLHKCAIIGTCTTKQSNN